MSTIKQKFIDQVEHNISYALSEIQDTAKFSNGATCTSEDVAHLESLVKTLRRYVQFREDVIADIIAVDKSVRDEILDQIMDCEAQ